jgi:PLP dependent protein
MTVAARLAAVRADVDAAARAAGRSPADVALVAVSKGQPAALVQEAWVAGQRDYGESYAQELQAKREELDGKCPGIRWHFIGRVQRKKAAILAATALVHGVASVEQARALGARRVGQGPLPVLLQVNVGGEESKSGFSPAGLRADLQALRQVEGVALRGLMCIPPDDGQPARWFALLRALRDETAVGPELSMGMSGDYRAAVAAGATLVRVGTAIFGARPG